MALWLHLPLDYLNNAHDKADEFIMMRHGGYQLSKDLLEDEDLNNDLKKQKDEDELTMFALTSKR